MAAAERTSAQTGVTVTWEDVSSDPFAYWRMLADYWTPIDDLVIVEHDVELRPDIITGFRYCPKPWCLHWYHDPGYEQGFCHQACIEAWSNALGCTRFRKELIAATPDAVTSIPDEWNTLPQYPNVHRRDWRNLCDELAGDKIGGAGVQGPPRSGSIRDAGYRHHFHKPPVVHWDRNVDPEFWYGPGGRYDATGDRTVDLVDYWANMRS